jgi:hypothetical protein
MPPASNAAPPLTLTSRVVVTGVDDRGLPVVLTDQRVNEVDTVGALPGWSMERVWATVPNSGVPGQLGTAEGELRGILPLGATRLTVWHLPPVSAGPNPAGMHQTDTIDYVYVVSGSVTLVLPGDVEVNLAPTDCLVQLGNLHEWVNRSDEVCTMLIVMVGGSRV